MKYQLNEYGFITNYLVSGRKETDFSSSAADKNQLACEKMMRSEAADHDPVMPASPIVLGALSALGLPWEYEYTYGSWFVDRSSFYPLLTRVELHAATILNAREEMEAEVWLWSYAAVDLWVNGVFMGGIETPVYKPISRKIMKLPLKKGDNTIYIRLVNLGVRDTRTLFGIQIPGQEREMLSVMLPDAEKAALCSKAADWLSGIMIREKTMVFPAPAPEGSRLIYDARPVDFTEYRNRYSGITLRGETELALAPDKPYLKVVVTVSGQTLSRSFERQELLTIQKGENADPEENKRRVFERIAGVKQIPRGDSESFSMYPILARFASGRVDPEDEREIYKSFDQIESRRDCSDFLTCAMVRFMKLYPMNEAMAARCKEVMINYRYWMDEAGSDGMCFWSENHSLMFFVSAYVAGDIYPEELFIRSGKTGREMKETARQRIRDWMVQTEREGFDEFHSGGYTPITFAAILNVVDFCDGELSALAWKAADRLLKDLAVQTFQGVSISPMGRVYREALYPYKQDIQCLINLIDPEAPDQFSEWIIFLATSKYRLPKGLKEMMYSPASLVYEESNARICVEKQKDYMLTSVESPRRDGRVRKWENISEQPDADTGSFSYVKSLNECFHGTTQFEPGVYGYQQHMWYAALDPAAVVFVNHPGGSCESCTTRPGYWFGNGIMPALKQVKEVLCAIYRIPETHPIPFTHVYWPSSRFSYEIIEETWLAGSAGGGYVALWCSDPFTAYDDLMFHCEYRVKSRDAAYVCICGSRKDYGSLEEFLLACKERKPAYDREKGRLRAGNEEITYRKYENMTQYI